MDHVHAGGERKGSHQAGSMRMYLIVGGLSVVLTIIAFLLVWASIPLRPYLLPIILVMAAFQVALQTILFMHLNLGRRLYSLFFGFGMSMALIVAGGVFIITASQSPGVPSDAGVSGQGTTPSSTAPAGAGSSSSGSSSSGSGSSGSSSSGSSSSGQSSQALAQQIITTRCQACHVVNGSGGNIGPDLNAVMAGKVLPGMVPGGHPTQQAWLAAWITDPQKIWPQAIMPALGLSPSQVQAVTAYLLKLK